MLRASSYPPLGATAGNREVIVSVPASAPLEAIRRSGTAAAFPQATPSVPRERAVSIDCLRGLVIILMALDHTRSFLSSARFEAVDLVHTTPPLFFTRWVTHFCA